MSDLGRTFPEIRLVADPQSAEAREVCGYEYAPPEVGTRHKLGGMPDLVQDDEWPACSDCSTDMTFYAQLDSIGDSIDLADCGVIHVYVCFGCFTTTSRLAC